MPAEQAFASRPKDFQRPHAEETTALTAFEGGGQGVNASILASAIAPVILVLALGFGAGKHHSFSADQASGLSQLALTYALPAALFLGMAQFNRSILIEQGPIAALMLVGYSGL